MSKPTLLIIAGGANSRFFPLNTRTHKGFLSLLGKPLIVRGLENAANLGFTKAVIVVSEKDYEGNGFSGEIENWNVPLEVVFVLQPEANGQGDAILAAREHISEDFVLASPYYTNMGDLADQLWQTKQQTGADCVLLASESVNPSIEGILSVEGDRVTGVIEKPNPESAPSKLRVRSMYLFNQDFLDTLASTPSEEYSLETAYDNHAKTAFYTYSETNASFPTLKYTWHLFDVQKTLFANLETTISPNAAIAKTTVIDDSKGPVIIEVGARIGDFAKLVGPCYVGRDVRVGDYSFIREISLEANVTVGANTEVVRSIMFEGSSLHFGYLADSIVGHETKIGAGLLTANKRLDRWNILVELKGKKVDSLRNNLGVIIGEKSQVGVRVTTMPGTLIGAEATIYPSQTIWENLAHQEVKKA